MSDKIAWKEQKDVLLNRLLKLKDRKGARDLDCVFGRLLHRCAAGPKSQCLMLWLRICELEGIVVDMVFDSKDRKIGFLGISSFLIPSDKVLLFNSELFLDPFSGETWNREFWRRCGFEVMNEPNGLVFTFSDKLYIEKHPHLKKRGAAELLAPLQSVAEELLCDEVMPDASMAVAPDAIQSIIASLPNDIQPVVAKDIEEIKRLTDAARQAKLDAQNEAAVEIAKAEALEMYAKALQDLETETAKVKRAKTRTDAAMAKIAELEGKK